MLIMISSWTNVARAQVRHQMYVDEGVSNSANRRRTIQQWSGRLLQTNTQVVSVHHSRPPGALLSPPPVAMSRAALARAAGLAAGRVASSSASPASFARVSSGSGLGGSSLVASPSIVGPGRWASSLPRDALPGSSRSLFELAAREARSLRDASLARLALARRAPALLREAAESRAKARLVRLLGPRAAETLVRRLLPDVFDPLGRVRRGALSAAAFARRHRDHAAVVAGAFATVGVWHALLVAEATLARDPSATADPTREVASLALALALVTLAGRSIRRRNRVDPDRVHHLAMRRLERHAGLREVLGAPITSPSPRACAFVGGEWTRAERLQSPSSPNDPSSPEPGTLLRRLLAPLAAWVPRGYAWMPHAVHLAFPVAGARHRGVVVASARKTRGRHEMDLLVVDVRARDGQRHRVFLVGAPPTPSARRVPESSSEDDSEDASSVETSSESVSVVHAPLLAALEAAGGDAYDAERRREEEARRRSAAAAEAARMEARRPKPMDLGGGMWPGERFVDGVQRLTHGARMEARRVREAAAARLRGRL